MKNLKQTLLSLILLLSISSSHAQIIEGAGALLGGLVGPPQVVTDPTNKIQLVTLVAETKKTYNVINDQLDLLKKAKDALEKINDQLRTIRMIDDITYIQGQIFDYQKSAMDAARELRILNAEEVAEIVSALNNTLIASESSLTLVTKLLTEGVFDMTTAERLEMLRETKRELQEQRATARYLDRQIRNYASLAFLDNIYAKTSPSLRSRTNR